MHNLNVVVALITRDNDYQAEQAAAAVAAANLHSINVQIIYADNDAVNQTQQLVKLIQEAGQRPDAILVEPVGTEMVQVAKAANAAGIAWGILNREPDYLVSLRNTGNAPAFAVTTDQEEVGRIQGRQLAALVSGGNVLCIEGPSSSSAARLRTKGMQATKPAGAEIKMLRGDWTEHSAHQSVKSWLALSTSRQLQVKAVICHNDAMAIGARKALMDLTEKDRERWMNTPFTGCDGLPKTGQEWVRRGILKATIITRPTAGVAVDVVVKAMRGGPMPAERTTLDPLSFPALSELSKVMAPHASATGATRVFDSP